MSNPGTFLTESFWNMHPDCQCVYPRRKQANHVAALIVCMIASTATCLRLPHTVDLACCQSPCIGGYTLAHAACACRYNEAPHLQLLLGPPGIGKTNLLRNLGRCITNELNKSPDWPEGSDGFRESLNSSLGAPIPFVFELVCARISTLQRLVSMPVSSMNQLAKHPWPWVGLKPYSCAAESEALYPFPLLTSPIKAACYACIPLQDLSEHVADQFGSPLMQSVRDQHASLLALLMLMCVVRAIEPAITGLASLVHWLPDELLATLQPQHVARFVHNLFPRTSNISSTQIYAFDEVRLPITTKLLLICASGQTATSLLILWHAHAPRCTTSFILEHFCHPGTM